MNKVDDIDIDKGEEQEQEQEEEEEEEDSFYSAESDIDKLITNIDKHIPNLDSIGKIDEVEEDNEKEQEEQEEQEVEEFYTDSSLDFDSDAYDEKCKKERSNHEEEEDDKFGIEYLKNNNEATKSIVTESLYERLLKRDYKRYNNSNINNISSNNNNNCKKRKDLFIYSTSDKEISNSIIKSSTYSLSNPSFFKEEEQYDGDDEEEKFKKIREFNKNKLIVRKVKQLTSSIVLDPIDPTVKNSFQQYLIQRELKQTKINLNVDPSSEDTSSPPTQQQQPQQNITTTTTTLSTTSTPPQTPIKKKRRSKSDTKNIATVEIEPFTRSLSIIPDYGHFFENNSKKVKESLNWETLNIKNTIPNNSNSNQEAMDIDSSNSNSEEFIKFDKADKEVIYYYMIYYSSTLLFYQSDKLWKMISNHLNNSIPPLKIGIFITSKLESNQSFDQWLSKYRKKYFKHLQNYQPPHLQFPPTEKSYKQKQALKIEKTILKSNNLYKKLPITTINSKKEEEKEDGNKDEGSSSSSGKNNKKKQYQFVASEEDLIIEEFEANKLLEIEKDELKKEFNEYEGGSGCIPQILSAKGIESLLTSEEYNNITPYPTIFTDMAEALRDYLKPVIQELTYSIPYVAQHNSDVDNDNDLEEIAKKEKETEITPNQVLEALRVTQTLPYDDWKPSKRFKKLYNQNDHQTSIKNNNNNNNNNNNIDMSLLFRNLK